MKAPVRILSAGSMRHALPPIVEAFGKETGIKASIVFGPAGLLRERIEGGEGFDLFISANMAHPRRLADAGLANQPLRFAQNRLVVIARANLCMRSENFLEVLMDPTLKIGTSTPGDDPSGDYAFDVFESIEAQHAGWGDALKARALQLVGGRNSPSMPAGKGPGYLIAAGYADLMMSYYSNARLLASDPDFDVATIPDMFAPQIEYGICVRRDGPENATGLQSFIRSEQARSILIDNGFTVPS